MNRSDQPRTMTACLGFSNLATYQTHGPPYFGRGVNAPTFAATPMQTAFARGNETIPKDVHPQISCCGNYKFSGQSNWMDMSKMMRCKKDFFQY